MVDFIESLLNDGLPVPEPTPLLNPTVEATALGTFTFTTIKNDNRLHPKSSQTYRDEYFLLLMQNNSQQNCLPCPD